MKSVEKYINSICNNFSLEDNELEDFKAEIRNHLMENIKDLQAKGHSEEESIKIAVDRFGEEKIIGEFSEVLTVRRDRFIKILVLALTIIPSILIFRELVHLDGLNRPFAFLILLPIYFIYQGTDIYLKHKRNIKIDKKIEIIKGLFIICFINILGRIIFPLDCYADLSKSKYPYINLVPFSNLVECIKTQDYYFLQFVLLGLVRTILCFIPLGLLTPMLFNEFKSIKKISILPIGIFIFQAIFETFKAYTGRFGGFIYTESLIKYILGTIIGYGLYCILNKKQTNYFKVR
ncbi:VanZ like family protein [Clostridium cavendishii DSM 21758]|uniref:VanZ like family protein n=1 Tax=Clostridium cavendishii DSM 21758 TaxID=1121302 RepID=A0A1M6EEI1_9CLOT|nr:VanZ family protein [Clostridium cavendishii]SHI83799.1 VanZ like family protein [Clostridium cavendishii DSM 21758]